MSVSASLQKAIFDALLIDAGVYALVADRVFDGPPPDRERIYPDISFGPVVVLEEDADCITGRVEVVQLDCWARDGGRLVTAKRLADAVRKALHKRDLTLASGVLVEMRVDLMRVFADPDGLTAHGVVQVRCMIEED